MHRVADCVADRIRFAVPQPTEWQRVSDQINAAPILARRHREARTAGGELWQSERGACKTSSSN